LKLTSRFPLTYILALAALPLVAQQGPPATFQNLVPPNQMAFVQPYDGKQAKHLLGDGRYKALMAQVIPNTAVHYGLDMKLAEAVDKVMHGSKEPVTILNGRYASLGGGTGPYLHGRGLVWMDLQTGTVLGAFYYQPTNGEPSPTLTVFSRQLTGPELGMAQLPAAFAASLNDWERSVGAPLVSVRYFIPADGRKYVLVHDENYCTAASAEPASPTRACDLLAEHAAQLDLHAAYFMADAQNAANARAWRTQQVERIYLSGLARTCGAAVGCITTGIRSQVRVLLGR